MLVRFLSKAMTERSEYLRMRWNDIKRYLLSILYTLLINGKVTLHRLLTLDSYVHYLAKYSDSRPADRIGANYPLV